jgi:serine/threonine protein kinase
MNLSQSPRNIGRFEIRRELGRGAQSAVYLAFDPQLQREVAIKTLHFDQADVQRNQALLDEARAVSKLSHPNIVPIYDMGEQDGDPYLVFEFVSGPHLGELIRREGRLPVVRAADLMRQVLAALIQAHAAGIVHRDLKPSNILIDDAGNARVMDFGIAERLDQIAEQGAAAGLTGTPIYMSPEYVDRQVVTPQFDVHAAGLVLYEMLAGERAIKGESLAQIAYQIVHMPVSLPTGLGVDGELASIVAQACAKDPALRLQSAEQMKQRLDDYLGAAAMPIGNGADVATQSTVDFLMRRMRHKTDFPALSDSVSAINRLTGNDKESINSLSNTILRDYGLTNKILRLVNSAMFRQSGGGNISTVSRAVMTLGFDRVRNIAITVLLFEHMQDKGNARELKEAFLRASLAGVLARDASRKLMAREAEQAYICALFHNLGQLLGLYYFPEEMLEIRKLMLEKQCTESQAAIQVLGLSFSDLGVGIARFWGFPEDIISSLAPLPEGVVRKPRNQSETLRVLAGFANEVCGMISGPVRDKESVLRKFNQRFATAMPFTERQLSEMLDGAYAEIGELAKMLQVNPKQSSFAKQVVQWAQSDVTIVANSGRDASTLGDVNVLANQPLDTSSGEPLDESMRSEHAQQVLSAGIQDISNALVEDFSLNDVLRITLETMYRAIGFQRVLLCLRDPRTARMTGRFGFGRDVSTLAKAFSIPLDGAADVFQLSMNKAADIIINDVDDPKIAGKIPAWYRSGVSAKTFILLPLTIKGRPVAMIYADREVAGSIQIPERELLLLKTLRNQALLALKQSV